MCGREKKIKTDRQRRGRQGEDTAVHRESNDENTYPRLLTGKMRGTDYYEQIPVEFKNWF